MRDVAQAVGVSPMTVSRALRDDETVSAKTRTRIKETASSLGYVYDISATAFRTQKSGFVAVTLPSINNANFAHTYRGLSEAMSPSGIQLLLGATNYEVAREENLIRQLLARNPEALVVTGGHHTDATRAMIQSRGLPVIEMWDLPKDPLGHSVGFSNADAMVPVVEHLAAQGRQKLAFVGASNGGDARGRERREGAVLAARRLGFPEIDLLDAGPAPVSMRQGAGLTQELGRDVARYDAIMCVSDPVAFGVLSECRRMGLSVPDDLAITGFGHFDVAAISHPRITTVDVSAERIGQNVAELLGRLFEGDMGPQRIDVGARLILGETG
ncbi:MAG: LacI family DNA-binding transcriptional regulator [Pseudomonadota bacterium]